MQAWEMTKNQEMKQISFDVFVKILKLGPQNNTEVDECEIDKMRLEDFRKNDTKVWWCQCVGNNASPKQIITKRFIRLKFYYIFTFLKIYVLISTFPCYKYSQNAKSLNFDPFIHTGVLSQLFNKTRSQVINKRS